MALDARARLLERQRALLRSLLADDPAPQGFDAEHLSKVAATLRAKRARTQRARTASSALPGPRHVLRRVLERIFGRPSIG